MKRKRQKGKRRETSHRTNWDCGPSNAFRESNATARKKVKSERGTLTSDNGCAIKQ